MQNILRFVRVAREYPGVTRRYVVSQLLLLATVILQLLIPFMIRIIIDDGIVQRDLELVFTTAFWMAVFSLVAAITSGISAYYSVGFAVDAAHEIRVRSYEKIGTLSFGNLDRFQTSDLLVRLTSDVNIVKQMIMYVTFFFFRAPFTLIGAIGLVFLTSPSLFWILVVVLLFTAVLMWIYARYAQPLYTAVQTKLDWLNRVLQENLAGVRVIKAFVRAEHEEHRFDDRNVVLRETAVKPMRLLSFLQPALFLVLNLGTIGALWFGGDQVVNSGDATVGEIVTFTNYLLTAMIPMVILAVLLPQISRAEASLKRIYQVIDAEPDVREKPDAKPMPDIEGHVVFENVSFSYLRDDGTPTDKAVLKGINLQARPGEVVALLGATGSGKSSLIHLIPRFYDVTEGRVTIDGVDVRDMRLQDLRSQIGIALQQAILFSGIVSDNIRYGRPEATQEDVERVAKVADADGFISAQVEGYDARVAREGANFSGGQRQRISIARALAVKPRILILDDSTSAVDVATETRIQAALQELLTDTTTFIVAQRISTVLVADKIVILDNGEIVAEGTHKELLDTSPLYREIYESQLGSLEDVR